MVQSIPTGDDTVDRMNSSSTPYSIELEPEVRDWLATLPSHHYERVEAHADHLAENAETLGEPRSRHLGGKLRELRFQLDGASVRIAYWLAPGRRIILLTVFKKSRRRQHDEVGRAMRAQIACEAGHEIADTVWAR
jgi:hypothetical protein